MVKGSYFQVLIQAIHDGWYKGTSEYSYHPVKLQTLLNQALRELNDGKIFPNFEKWRESSFENWVYDNEEGVIYQEGNYSLDTHYLFPVNL